MASHEKLKEPPLSEVICGLIFSPLPIDPLRLGAYWAGRRKDFPRHQLQPALGDDQTLFIGGVPPTRTWFISEDDVFVLQMQHDRFYLNWRARDKAYPRFTDREGHAPGLLSRLLDEFGLFSKFCLAEFGSEPKPTKIELAKVDHLVQGQHWKDFEDLTRLLPIVAAFRPLATTSSPIVGTRFNEERDGERLAVSIDTALGQRQDNSVFRLIKIETRTTRVVREEFRTELTTANDVVNDVFFKIIPKEQRDARFNAG
jgi:uncharacterized protein (TIGR04255 family)